MTLVHTFSKQQVTFMITRSFKNHLSIKHFKSQFTVKGINASAACMGVNFGGDAGDTPPLILRTCICPLEKTWKHQRTLTLTKSKTFTLNIDAAKVQICA